MRVPGCLVAMAVSALLSAAPAAAQAGAQQQQVDELGLSVAVGFDGRGRANAWHPVAVTLEPVRPISGTLSVESRTGGTDAGTESIGIEVAAGSRKVYRFLQPSGLVRVTFSEGGADDVSVRPSGNVATTEYIVGLLGDDPGSLAPLRSETTGQSGAWVGLDAAWVEESPLALQPLAAVVAEPADLQGLTPRGQTNLALAVADGMDLIVVASGAVDGAALGLPWDLTGGGWQLRNGDVGVSGSPNAVVAEAFPAGEGRVVVTAARPGEGVAGRSAELWSAIAQPMERLAGQNTDFGVTSASHQFARLFSEPGTGAPTVPGLGAFVLVYVLIVGPVNAVILGRLGRRELAWATVPLITVIFTTGAFFGATAGRPATGGVARLTYWADGPATEFIASSVRTATPGQRAVTLPGDQWEVRPLVDSGRRVSVLRTQDTSVSMDLQALQLGGVAAWRSSAEAPPLEVEATARRDGVRVTVRNVSDRPLSDVVVRTATIQTDVPHLAPGAQETVALGGTTLPQASAYRDPFEGLPFDEEGVVGAPLSLRAVLNGEVADGTPGMVWVSAVDEDATQVAVSSDGGTVRDLGSMVAVGERIATDPPPLSPFTITRAAYADGGEDFQPGPEAIEGAGEVFLRFRLPVGAQPAHLTNQLDNSRESGGQTEMSVWDRGQRQWVPAPEAFTGDRTDLVSPLGEVWARASGELFPFEYSGRTIAGGDQ